MAKQMVANLSDNATRAHDDNDKSAIEGKWISGEKMWRHVTYDTPFQEAPGVSSSPLRMTWTPQPQINNIILNFIFQLMDIKLSAPLPTTVMPPSNETEGPPPPGFTRQPRPPSDRHLDYLSIFYMEIRHKMHILV